MTGRSMQPWDFIIVTDREQLRALAALWRGAAHVAGSAATIVVIGPAADNEFHRAQLDLGQATMAMLLAALVAVRPETRRTAEAAHGGAARLLVCGEMLEGIW